MVMSATTFAGSASTPPARSSRRRRRRGRDHRRGAAERPLRAAEPRRRVDLPGSPGRNSRVAADRRRVGRLSGRSGRFDYGILVGAGLLFSSSRWAGPRSGRSSATSSTQRRSEGDAAFPSPSGALAPYLRARRASDRARRPHDHPRAAPSAARRADRRRGPRRPDRASHGDLGRDRRRRRHDDGFKASGPVLLGRVSCRPGSGCVEVLAPAMLASLVVTQAVGGDREIVFDERSRRRRRRGRVRLPHRCRRDRRHSFTIAALHAGSSRPASSLARTRPRSIRQTAIARP